MTEKNEDVRFTSRELEFTANIPMPPEYKAKVDNFIKTAEVNGNKREMTLGNDAIGTYMLNV